MDFMEDVKHDYPNLYKRGIKKSGNDFIDEVSRMTDSVYSKVASENDEDVIDFYTEVVNMGNVFNEWLADL
jgi:hypothetical protein